MCIRDRRIPALQPIMYRYFTSNPGAKAKCLPMLLCAFSHHGSLHFLFNMYALYNFGPPLIEVLGKEHFLGLYSSAAVISSMTSYIYRVSTFTIFIGIFFLVGSQILEKKSLCWRLGDRRAKLFLFIFRS